MSKFLLGRRWADITLRTKITAVTVFILTIGLLVAGAGTMALLKPQLIHTLETDLERLRIDPIDALAPGADPREIYRNDVLYASNRYYVAIIDADGKFGGDNRRSNDTPVPRVPDGVLTSDWVAQNAGGILNMKGTDGVDWRAVASPVSGKNGEAGATLLIASSTAQVNRVMGQFFVIFSGFGIAVIMLGAALTRILVTTTFLPLAEVERTALEISRGNFSRRIMVDSPHTEVGHLGESLNVMLDHIDASFTDRAHTIDQMRRFIGDAGHELRTPLVSVRGYAELYRMGALQDEEAVSQAMERIEKEAIRMTSLVEDLLSLARLDERRPLQLTRLSLNKIAADAALDTRAQEPDREVTAIEHHAGPVVVGDEHKVRQVMTNLLGNALRYSPDGSPIEIAVGCDAATKRAWFEIIDHGEGIPEQLRAKIFDRFWRADSSRNRDTGGSGLGLAIVQSIVSAHDGAVSVDETPGGGATFRVELPLADPE